MERNDDRHVAGASMYCPVTAFAMTCEVDASLSNGILLRLRDAPSRVIGAKSREFSVENGRCAATIGSLKTWQFSEPTFNHVSFLTWLMLA